ncbi:alkene reductase [Kineococcus sp. SYSU DK005]|uniref:alkene reductase n=1 Tax=Kineococcus sp. SYSU DK005 TaxID=3383126 RepID=UPI003D7CD5BD
MPTAFDPITIGNLYLANRITMAPMTRSRAAVPGATATALMAQYYAQRASAGLIITEGVQPSVVGQGYINTPGLHSTEQVQSWREVTGAVHAAGGKIVAQLMHTGRIGHPDSYAGDPMTPVAPSPVKAAGQTYTPTGLQDFVVPRELTGDEIKATVRDFAQAARNAIEAGFDGVELHGANGYLLHQFLSTNVNRRQDDWGGSVQGRIRFTLEVARTVAATIGAGRTGLRISPGNTLNDIVEDAQGTYPALLEALNPIGLAYLHVMETVEADLTRQLRTQWQGAFILNPVTPGSATGAAQLQLIENGSTDLLSFGAAFLANPDLPARLAAGGPYNTPDFSTAYGGGAVGYTDYPTLP